MTTLIPGLDALISPDVGVVSLLRDGTTGWERPRLHSAFATVCDTTILFGQPLVARAGGVAHVRSHARARARGEALERYSATLAPLSRLRRARLADLRDAVAIDGCHPRGKDGVIDASVTQHWVQGIELGTGRPAWLPACRAFMTELDQELGVEIATSSGLACHVDPWMALRSALLEVIERDAVMVSWFARLGGRRLRWHPSAAGLPVALGDLDLAPDRYRLYQLPSPVGLPTVFGVAFGAERSSGTPVGAAVGAAAGMNLTAAAIRVATETVQTMRWAQMMVARLDQSDPGWTDLGHRTRIDGDPGDAGGGLEGGAGHFGADLGTDLDDHVRMYLDPARRTAFDFLDDGADPPVDLAFEPDQPRSARQDVADIVDALRRAGMRAYACDVTSPEIRECGGWVVRAIVPELYPLEVGLDSSHPRHPRLAGWSGLNPDPHPFP